MSEWGGSKNGDTNNHKFIKYNIALARREIQTLDGGEMKILKIYSFIIVCVFNLIYGESASLDTQFRRKEEKFLNFQTTLRRE